MRAITLALALFTAAPAFAADYQIDVPHTQVFFSVNHMGFSNSTGLLSVKEGTFSFDEKDWGKSKLAVTINVGSLQLGDKTWNEHMADAKFFNTAKFPTMQFVSTKVEKLTETTGKVMGNLTMLGITKPVTLMITKNKVGENPMSKKGYAGFSATGTLKRSDWGMVAYAGAIGDEITMRIEVEASEVAKKK